MKHYSKFMVSIMVAISMAAIIMGATVEESRLDILKERTKQIQGKDMTNRGMEVIEKLIDGKYAELIKNMNEEMKAVLNGATLAQSFKSAEQLYGAFKSYEFEEELKVGDLTQYNIRIVYEKSDVKAIVVFDQQGKISGLQLTPYVKERSKPKDSVEKEIVVQTGDYKLPAILMLPKEKGSFPIVVLVHGSGPNDRDETVLGVKVFRDIAYELAEQGIATLRYDKRTYVYADKVKENPSLFDYNEEVIDDAISAIELAKTLPEVNKGGVRLFGDTSFLINE